MIPFMYVVMKIAIFTSKLINCLNTMSSAQRKASYIAHS